jgi:hypothetical protein
VVSRLIFGWLLNRIGGLSTLVSLYVVSATFGLAEGGLVPSYAVVNRIEAIGLDGGLLVPATEAHGLALEFVSCQT